MIKRFEQPTEWSIMHLIQTYGCMAHSSISKLYRIEGAGATDSRRQVAKTLNFLESRGYICKIQEHFWGILPSSVPDAPLIIALWILAELFPDIPVQNHWPGNEEGQVHFMDDNISHDILYIKPQAEWMAQKLVPDEEGQRYIFVINKKEQIDKVMNYVPEGISCLFTIPKFGDGGYAYPPKDITKFMVKN